MTMPRNMTNFVLLPTPLHGGFPSWPPSLQPCESYGLGLRHLFHFSTGCRGQSSVAREGVCLVEQWLDGYRIDTKRLPI